MRLFPCVTSFVCDLWWMTLLRTASGECRALGDADYKDPKPFVSAEASVRRLDLLPEDKAVIIASDGLWDVIGDQDVVTMVDQLIKVHALSHRCGAT